MQEGRAQIETKAPERLDASRDEIINFAGARKHNKHWMYCYSQYKGIMRGIKYNSSDLVNCCELERATAMYQTAFPEKFSLNSIFN